MPVYLIEKVISLDIRVHIMYIITVGINKPLIKGLFMSTTPRSILDIIE